MIDTYFIYLLPVVLEYVDAEDKYTNYYDHINSPKTNILALTII